MRIFWIHRDRCPDCDQIIWTQRDDLPAHRTRPNLKCQCYCGTTLIEDEHTVVGGGGNLTEADFKKEVVNAYPQEKINIVKWQPQV